MKKLIFNFTIFTIFLAFSNLHATAMGPGIDERGLETPIITEQYILMPGDNILVIITGATNYSYRTTVTYEGKVTISIPVTSMTTAEGIYVPKYDIVSAVPIYNLSLKSAKDSLKNVFLKYFRNIDVDITLFNMRTFTVFVAGEVKRPGIAFAKPIDRVSTIIDTVGGVAAIGSRSQIELRRKGRFFKLVDLEEFERTGNLKVNPCVQDGDLIYVPRIKKSVIVIGAIFGKKEYGVTEPTPTAETEISASAAKTNEGLYELIEGETVSDIIAKVEITPWADLTNVYIKRNDQSIPVNLANVFADENCEENIEMEDGDVLHIPLVNTVVYVEGHVANPGSFTYQPNMKTSDYIGLAGGPKSGASMSGAYVQRNEKKIALKDDPIIEQGDKIFVPRQIIIFWQDYLEIGAVVASLLISYLTLTAVSN